MVSEEQKRLDRIDVVFHEAGHAVVGLALGLEVINLTLAPCVPDNDDHRCFRAQTAWYEQLKPEDRAIFGLAGWLAERIVYDLDSDADQLLDDLHYVVDFEMSETDKVLVLGLSVQELEAAMNVSFNLLKKHWAVVEAVAYELAYNKNGLFCATPALLAPETKYMGRLKRSDVGPFPNLD